MKCIDAHAHLVHNHKGFHELADSGAFDEIWLMDLCGYNLGGINAGIRTCWVNPAHAPARANIQPDYEIENLSQLEEVLKTL